MFERIYAHITTSLTQGQSPSNLAYAIALGVYIAFSPFPCCHSLMVILFSWLFGLNMPVVFICSNLVNNPWTLVPVYSAGYMCGKWVVCNVLAINAYAWNPWWMQYINTLAHSYLGIADLSLLSFMVGGNLLGMLGAGIIYPLAKHCIAQISLTAHRAGTYHEVNYQK